MKFISRIPNYAHGMDPTIIEFGVLAQLVKLLKQKTPNLLVGFRPTTKGFGYAVLNQGEDGQTNEVLAVYHCTEEYKDLFGHVIGTSNEIKRFLGDLQKQQTVTSLKEGDTVLFDEKPVIVQWVSADNTCAGGLSPSGKGRAFMFSDSLLKKVL